MLVVGGHKWRDISMGTRATCGVTTSDRAYCWGEMRPPSEQPPPYGLLGTGSFTGSKSPVPVAGDLSFASISVGTRHVCGVTTDKQAWCWGSNASSELGTGSPSPSRASPQRVVGGLDFANLNAEGVTCGISANKNLFCWGITAAGALGNGVKAGGMRAIPTRASDPAP
jgi:alpha-tubulin suppressor-like RCC1 family protein